MVKERNNKYSTVISLGLHIGVVALVALFGKPISVLVPSRSDGIEVSLVSMPQPTEVETYKPVVKAVPAPLKVMDTPADVNIKQDKPQPKPNDDVRLISELMDELSNEPLMIERVIIDSQQRG